MILNIGCGQEERCKIDGMEVVLEWRPKNEKVSIVML